MKGKYYIPAQQLCMNLSGQNKGRRPVAMECRGL